MNPSQDRNRSLLDVTIKVTPSLPPRGVCSDFDYRDPEAFVVTRGAPEVAPEMEDFANLDPETKSLVLRAGAEFRGLKITRRDIAASERFFAVNPEWTAGHLLALLERCGKLGKPSEDWDALWHAKMGAQFKFLLLHLRRVLIQLRAVREFPALRDFPPEEFYKSRRRQANKEI